MSRKKVLVITDEPTDVILTVTDICEHCGLTREFVEELVSYDIIKPIGAEPAKWQFDAEQLYRIKRAVRLQKDLEMNLASMALVLELLEELEFLRERAAVWDKHFGGPLY